VTSPSVKFHTPVNSVAGDSVGHSILSKSTTSLASPIDQLSPKSGSIKAKPINLSYFESSHPPAKKTGIDIKQKLLPIIKVKALYNYEPKHDDELAFNTGDIIDLVVAPKVSSLHVEGDESSEDEGWSKGSINGNVGVFPLNYVKQLDKEEIEAQFGLDRVNDEDEDDPSDHDDDPTNANVRYAKNTAERYKSVKL
jgi:hypothetical protein